MKNEYVSLFTFVAPVLLFQLNLLKVKYIFKNILLEWEFCIFENGWNLEQVIKKMFNNIFISYQ